MGGIYEECERMLADWRKRYAGQPRRELSELFLLALEREEIVAIGYREAVMLARLRQLDVPAGVRDLLRQALVWIWKDEEMHSVYIRGAILRLGGLRLRGRAFLYQLSGAVGGWSGSVRQHVRWADAPLARGLATCFTTVGVLTGQIPREVRQHLQYRPFRDYCLFNLEAERTAELCWRRIAELAETVPDLPRPLLDDFQRITADELRHGRVFRLLADVLDEQDRLVPGTHLDRLTAQLGEVGEGFLPRLNRASHDLDHPLGSGGAVRVVRGTPAADKRTLFRQLLDEAGLPHRFRDRARLLGKSAADMRVVVKPTFMLGYHRKDLSPITDPELLSELGAYLHALGCRDVAVVEARTIYDHFFAHRSVREVANYFGLASPYYRIVDLSLEQVPHVYERGIGQATIGRTWKEADFRISFAKMRSHPVNVVHLNLGNMEGLGARCDEFLFVERQAHRPTAIMMVLDAFPPHFALLDAYERVPDGLVGVMGSPRPKQPLRLYAGGDALAVDRVAARHMGVTDPDQCDILRAAGHWFGNPDPHTEVIGPDEPIAGWRGPYHDDWSTALSFLAYPVYQFGSGRGALFVPEMDEAAFPPLREPGPLLRAGREAVRTLLRLRHPR